VAPLSRSLQQGTSQLIEIAAMAGQSVNADHHCARLGVPPLPKAHAMTAGGAGAFDVFKFWRVHARLMK
jgi:hypothetical protein